MNLLRVYVVVLMAGWFAWLLVDKSSSGGFGPGTGAVLPHAGTVAPFALPPPERPTRNPVPLPPPEGDTLGDFQYAMDMVRRGEVRQAFIVLWRRQYLWAAAMITALVMFVLVPGVRAMTRRGRRTPAAGPAVRRPGRGDTDS